MTSLRVRQRDRHSLEVKARSVTADGEGRGKRARDKVLTRLHFFLPYTFNIRPETFNEQDFYHDIKLYIRFDTPRLTIDEILDEDSDASPVNRIKPLLENPDDESLREAEYEMRLLGAMFKSLLRHQTRTFSRLPDGATDSALEAYCDLLSRMTRIIKRLGEYADQLEEAGCGQTYRLVDEYLSLSVEGYATRVLAMVRSQEETVSADGLEDHIRRQHKYRRKKGYRSAATGKEEVRWLEEYIYRVRLLKRYSLSVLYLDIRRRNQNARVEHLLYAIAAGVAMAVATGVSFLSQARFGNVSLALFLVLVGSYMVKDRLKDMLRSGFYRTLGRSFYDRRTVFFDGHEGTRLGVIKERVAYVPLSKLSPEITAARSRGQFEQNALRSMPETVIEYTRLLKLRTATLRRIHNRVQGVADIAIIDLKHLLRYLTRQRETVGIPGRKSVKLRNADRIYHLNLVVEHRSAGEVSLKRYRLLVAADGIRRIEPIDVQ